jgi:hypothetical protein
MDEDHLIERIHQAIKESKEYVSYDSFNKTYGGFINEIRDEFYALQKSMTKNVLNDDYFKYKQRYIEVKQIMESDPIFLEYNTRKKELNDLFQEILEILKIRR